MGRRRGYSTGFWIALAVTAFLISTARGASIFVDPQLGSAACNRYNPATRSCSGGSATAYQTIAAASAVAMPGDTVFLRGGTYGEQLRPATSGIPDLPITYAAYQGESVLVGANSTSNPGILLSDRSYLVIDGVQVQDRAWCEARNTHYCLLRRCTFLRTPATGTTGNVRFISATFNRIIDCNFIDGNDNLILIDANNNLVEGCTIGVGRHSVFGIRCGDYNIVRGNYLYNPLQHIVEVFDCGVDTSAVPNDFNSTHHNIFEENIIGPCELGAGFHDTTSNGNGIQYGGQDGIIRRNIFIQCNIGLAMQVYDDESLFNYNNRIYHNVFYQNKGAGISPRGGNTNTIYKNNILFQNGGCIGGCVAATSPGQVVYRTDSGPLPFGPGAFVDHNDIIFQTPGQPVFEAEFADSGETIAQFNALYPGEIFNTLEVDPQFENAATTNFHLRATSPLIDAGAFLTRTMLPGAGVVIPVEDPFSFTDGFGIPGEAGDVIQIEGQTETARILAVDYFLKTLTVDAPLLWDGDQGVSLHYNGEGPDLGAFETGETGLQLSATYSNGAVHIVWPAAAGYILVASDNVNGPYLPVLTLQNSYSEAATAGARFFQLMKP